MAENKNQLREETIDFAVAVSEVCENIHGCSVYVNQLLRCSSSIGANVYEAKYAQSRADFISKLSIALKETTESKYWIRLLHATDYLSSNEYHSILSDCVEIEKLLVSIIRTTKQK